MNNPKGQQDVVTLARICKRLPPEPEPFRPPQPDKPPLLIRPPSVLGWYDMD